jgi:hypothetical protein
MNNCNCKCNFEKWAYDNLHPSCFKTPFKYEIPPVDPLRGTGRTNRMIFRALGSESNLVTLFFKTQAEADHHGRRTFDLLKYTLKLRVEGNHSKIFVYSPSGLISKTLMFKPHYNLQRAIAGVQNFTYFVDHACEENLNEQV